MYNIAQESTYTDFVSPVDTEWAFGTTANLSNLTFDSWENTHGSDPLGTIGQSMVLHLITDDIYIDITFDSWSAGRSGGQGGFSYTRTTAPAASIAGVNRPINFYPNPAKNHIVIQAEIQDRFYQIMNLSGQVVLKETILEDQTVNLEELNSGVYFLSIDQRTVKLIVE